MGIVVAFAEGVFELVSLSAFLTTIVAGFALAAGHLPL
jgi:hypothetical protein